MDRHFTLLRIYSGQAGRCQPVNPAVQVAHVVVCHRFLEGCGKVRDVTLNTLFFEIQVVSLCSCKHLVSIVYVLLPLLHVFRQLGEQTPVPVKGVFGEFCLRILPFAHLTVKKGTEGLQQANQLCPHAPPNILLARFPFGEILEQQCVHSIPG